MVIGRGKDFKQARQYRVCPCMIKTAFIDIHKLGMRVGAAELCMQCIQELLNCVSNKPLVCLISNKPLDRNQGTHTVFGSASLSLSLLFQNFFALSY